MDSIVNAINSQAIPKDGNWDPFLNSLKSKTDQIVSASRNIEQDAKTGSPTTVILKIISNNINIKNTVGVAFILSVQSDNLPDGVYDQYFAICKYFFHNASKDQCVIAAKEVANISTKLAHFASTCGFKPAIIPLTWACHKTAPNENCLTPSHANLLQVCIAVQMYTHAVDVIKNTTILEIDPKNTGLSTSDYLRYFHYCGICFIAVKDYASALEAFTQVITTPANALSAIVVSSVKKAKLCSLILKGETFSVSNKLMSSVVSRHMSAEHGIYDEIEKCFLTTNKEALFTLVNGNAFQTLNKDLNYGLAKQALDALTKHRIKRLTKTYITLSLIDIGVAVGVPDVSELENLLVRMIRDGEVVARIDVDTQMVRFGPAPVNGAAVGGVAECKTSDLNLNHTLEASIQQTLILSERLKDLQKNVVTSSSYILKGMNLNSHTTSSSSRREGSGRGSNFPGMGGFGMGSGGGYGGGDYGMDSYF